MKISVRASKPDEGPAIAALLQRAGLKRVGVPLTQEQLHWKYWLERSDWPGPRSFVVARGSELLAHSGTLPGECAWPDRRARVIHMIDWAAAPEVLGAGVALMKHIAGTVDALIGVGGSDDTLRAMPVVGFKPRGIANGYALPLYPWRYLRHSERASWRTGPKLLRNLVWQLQASHQSTAGYEVEKLPADRVDSLDPVLPGADPAQGILCRSAGHFRYMLESPIARMSLYAIKKAGRLCGYFMLASVPGQVRLVDSWMVSRDPMAWRVLVQFATDAARGEPDVAELVAVASDALLSGALEAAGFHLRWSSEIQILVRRGQEWPAANLRFQMIDSDAAFNHLGFAQLWS